MSIRVFYSLSFVCQYLTIYRPLVLCHCVHLFFGSLSTACQYLTLYRLMVLCHYVHCCLLQACPLSLSTSYVTFFWFFVTVFIAAFCSLSNVCQYLKMYRLLVLCHYIHCCLLQSVHCLSVLHT